MYSIRQMKAIVSSHREGRAVPNWVRYVLEPGPGLPAHASEQPPAAAREGPAKSQEGPSREAARPAKSTLIGAYPPMAERAPAKPKDPQAARKTMPIARALEEAGDEGLSIEITVDASGAEETQPRRLTALGMQAPDGKDELVRKLRESPSSAERIAAAIALAGMVESIDDRDLLVDVAISCNHKYLSYHVVEKIGEDAGALHRIVTDSILDETVAHAFGKLCRMIPRIDDADILTLIAERSEVVREKAEAAAKLALEIPCLGLHALKAVAVSAPEATDRRKAVERLSAMAGTVGDVAALKIIAVYSEDSLAREEAVDRLENVPQALKTVATCALHKETKLRALGLLRDKDDLMEMALNNIDDEIGQAAVMGFGESEADLVRIYETAQRKPARDAAAACICAMAGSLGTVAGLKIAVLNGDQKERRIAIELLSAMASGLHDKHALMYVGIWGTTWTQRRHALSALRGDAEALGLVAETTEFEDSKKLAGRLLEEHQGKASGAD